MAFGRAVSPLVSVSARLKAAPFQCRPIFPVTCKSHAQRSDSLVTVQLSFPPRGHAFRIDRLNHQTLVRPDRQVDVRVQRCTAYMEHFLEVHPDLHLRDRVYARRRCCNVDRVSDGRMIGWTGYVKRQHRYRKIAIRGTRPKHTDDETRVVNSTRTRAAIQRIRKAFQAGKLFRALAALLTLDIECDERRIQIVAALDVAMPIHPVYLVI